MTPRSSFAELLALPGVEEDLELRSRFGFLAFHGGNLEAGTDVVAAQAAETAGASCYAVRQPPDLRWHIPSARVCRTASPALDAFLAHVEVAVAVHGYGRAGRWTTLLLGGANRRLAGHVAGHLRTALPGYEVVDDLAAIPAALRGLHPANPVNVPTGGGAQLELPPRVRGCGPFWEGHPSRREARLCPDAEALVAGLAAAARAWTSAESGRPRV